MERDVEGKRSRRRDDRCENVDCARRRATRGSGEMMPRVRNILWTLNSLSDDGRWKLARLERIFKTLCTNQIEILEILEILAK